MKSVRLGWLALLLASLGMFALGGGRWWFHSDPTRLLRQAQADYQSGHYEAAAAGMARLGQLRTPTPMDRMARALVARARGEGEDALADLAQIPDDHPLSPQAHLLAGQIEVQSGPLRQAEAHFLATLAREPKNVHAHHELAYIYNIQNRWRELDEQMDALSALNAAGFEHVLHWSKTRNGKWNSSRDCESLAKYLAADPADQNTRLALVDGLQNLGRLDEAVSALAPLSDADPEARARRALLALESGQTERAERLLAVGPPGHPSLAKARGQLALARRDPAGAIHHLRIALAGRPDDFGVLSALATALRISGDHEGARRYFEAANRHTALTPLIMRATTSEGENDSTLPARLGAACEAAGRFAEARAWYRLAIVRDPLDENSQHAIFRLRREPADRAQVGQAIDGGRRVQLTAAGEEGS